MTGSTPSPTPRSTAEHTRQVLTAAVLDFVASHDLLARHEVEAALRDEIDDAGPQALIDLKAHLTLDAGWDYYPADPLARRIHHLLADRFLTIESEIRGIEHLERVRHRRVLLFANHLSYADANVIEVLLHRAGATTLADRLTAIAGPKVFSERQRRFSSLCFGTIKVPQSAEVSSEDAVLPTREVARAARRAIDVARHRLEAGDTLLLFGEGTRSRTAAMRRLLPAVARYLEVADAVVLPIGLTGPEMLFPVNGTTIQPCRVVVAIGPPLSADALLAHAGRDRRIATDAIGLAIAALLPDTFRGEYGDAAAHAGALAALTAATCGD